MAVDKKFFVDINLQGSALNNATIGSNSDMTKGGSFRYNESEFRLEYFDGTNTQPIANLADISAVTGGLIFQTGVDCSGATPDPDITTGIALKGQFWVVETAGSFLGQSVQVGDSIIAKVDAAGASIGDWLILQGNVVVATDSVDGIVRLATQAEVDAGTEGGAVVLTPATFESSQQLSDIRTDISNLESDKLSLAGGTMSGNINMGGNDIDGLNSISTDSVLLQAGGTVENVPVPTNSTDAANKQYVDDNTTNKLPLSGGYMSGALNMGSNEISNALLTDVSLGGSLNANNQGVINLPTPSNSTDAANKQYVDDAAAQALNAANSYTDAGLALKLDLSGGEMVGGINMGANDISNVGSITLNGGTVVNVATPTDTLDAANKQYVDDAQAAAESYADGVALTAENNAKAYADSLAPNYDAVGAAATAESNANTYTDGAISQEVTDRNAAIATAKGEAIADANSYTDGEIAQEVIDRNAAIATAKSEAIADANAYTDAGLALKLDLTGGAMTGPISMGGVNEITDLAEPSTLQSAATKNYVDTQISGTIDAAFFEGTFVDTDWTLSGGVYTLSVLHGTVSVAPKVSCYVLGNLVEFAVVVIDNLTIELKSNIAAPASVIVGVSK